MPVTTNCISNQFEVEIKINFTGLDFKPKDRPYHIPTRYADIKVLDCVYGSLYLSETSLKLTMYGVKSLQVQSMYLAVDPSVGKILKCLIINIKRFLFNVQRFVVELE